MGVIFDCDGVIFDSNRMKNDIFSQTLSDYSSDQVERFLEYHKSNGGISRYVKFRYFFSDIIGSPIDDDLVNQLIGDYSELCYKAYQAAPFTKGALETIEKLSAKHDLFVASGSDEQELNRVFKDRGIATAFKKILGSPRPKAECLKLIVGDRPQNFVFVGDSTKDFEAAAEVGVRCVLMPTYSDQPESVEKLGGSCEIIRSIEELLDRY
ncbi:HAD family hydrolase [Labrenzia sp. VG12]|uniref:HAD family hydrolase n=1 Tax=Labrenzia sp. VG12 TaxID=2021862 RepID=UPI0012FE30C4|nr:HAD hydrolase-like protein [Labrenzia sp. VG12]